MPQRLSFSNADFSAGQYPARLKIAFASTMRGWGGGEEQLLQLACGLRKRGHYCFMLARHRTVCAERMTCEGFPVHTFLGTGCDPVSILRLRKCLKWFHPDVLHFNDANALTSAGLAAIGLPLSARIVSRRVEFPIQSVWRYRHLVDCVLCVSTAVADVCWSAGIPPESIRIVHDGVDPTKYDAANRERGRRVLGATPDQKVLLCVAKLTACKGHDDLLQSMSQIVREHSEVILALAGDGELAQSLRQEVRRLGLEPYVRFLGHRNDVPDLIAASDLFVMPSHLEGLCSSLIDAMFAARPIIATRAGGIPDLMGETFSPEAPVGWTCPPRNPEALATAIIEALSVPESERRLRRERAKRRAERFFTADIMVQRTLQVYKEMLMPEKSLRSGSRHVA